MTHAITRFPPSPTGYFHIGSARTALFNYLFAKHNGGKMYLRFEDTDKERSKKEFEIDILEGMKWLGIGFDTMPDIFRQSERASIYKKYIKLMLDKGVAYEAEGAQNDTSKKVIRFKNPNVAMTFKDEIRGEIKFDTTDLTDFVIAKSLDEPLYHLAVIIDDHEMKVSHVIRGEDHISNTPRQILMQEALGFERPVYAHIPLILAADRSKMSKRHGAVSLQEYRAEGYIPEAIVNFLALLGWNPGTPQEIFSLHELEKSFELAQVQKGGAIFNIEKLRWFNKEYLNKMDAAAFKNELFTILKDELEKRGLTWNEVTAQKLVTLVRERMHLWKDVRALVQEGELDFFFYDPRPAASELLAKDETPEVASKHLQHVKEILEQVSDDEFQHPEKIKAPLWDYATAEGRANVLWPTRFALTGRAKSPDPFLVASIIGKEAALRRINAALKVLGMS